MTEQRTRLVPTPFTLPERRPIATIPPLDSLRSQVLARSERRCPKWKFRVAPEIVMQLQPRPCPPLGEWEIRVGRRQQVLRFDGQAYLGPGLTEGIFTEWPPRSQFGVHHLAFTIYAEAAAPTIWFLKVTRATAGERDPATGDRIPVDIEANTTRLVDACTPATFVSLPAVMLGFHCLCCGKALSDPASRARGFGPECFGSSTLTVPGVWNLTGRAS